MLEFVGRFGSPVNGFIGGEGGGLWMRGPAAAGPGAGEESHDPHNVGKGERSATRDARRGKQNNSRQRCGAAESHATHALMFSSPASLHSLSVAIRDRQFVPCTSINNTDQQ